MRNISIQIVAFFKFPLFYISTRGINIDMTSTPTPLKGIAVDSETLLPSTYDYCSSDSYSQSSQFDWLREQEAEGCGHTQEGHDGDEPSNKRSKISEIITCSDASKDVSLEVVEECDQTGSSNTASTVAVATDLDECAEVVEIVSTVNDRLCRKSCVNMQPHLAQNSVCASCGIA